MPEGDTIFRAARVLHRALDGHVIVRFTPTADLSAETLARVLDTAHRLMELNAREADRTPSPAIGRRTTGSLDPHQKLWVYGRGGQPCRKCGARIQAKKTGLDARLTYWCPRCQAPLGRDASRR